MPPDKLRQGSSLTSRPSLDALKWMRATLVAVCILACLGIAMTFVVESGFSSRSRKVQLVRIDPNEHNPLGPVTVDEGPPTMMIIEDERILLKGTTSGGLPKVDIDALKRNPNSATTLPSVLGVIGAARFGCLIAAIATAIGAIYLPRVKVLSELSAE